MYFPVGNVTNPVEYMQWINSGLTGGFFGIGLLIGIFAIVFLSLKNYSSEKAFTTSSFFTAISSYFFLIIGIVEPGIVTITTVIFLASVFFLFGGQKRH